MRRFSSALFSSFCSSVSPSWLLAGSLFIPLVFGTVCWCIEDLSPSSPSAGGTLTEPVSCETAPEGLAGCGARSNLLWLFKSSSVKSFKALC